MKTLGLIRIIGAAAATAAAVVTLMFAATVGQAARPPVIAWSPVTSSGTFDYMTVDVGQAVSQTFVLTNSGGSATGMLRASLSGSGTFTITADACTGTAVGPGKSCNVTVQFLPTTAGQSFATLAANGKKPPSSASINLTGTGRITTGPGDLVLDPGFFGGTDEFGTKSYEDALVGSPTTQTFTVTNQSTTAASNPLSVALDNPAVPFVLFNDGCTEASLAPNGGSCEFDLTFTAPAGCTPGQDFTARVHVGSQTNDHAYIILDVVGACPQ